MNNSQFVPQIACIAASIWQKNQHTQRCPQKEKIKMWSQPNAHLIEWRYNKETDFQGWIELLEIAAKLTGVYTIPIFTFKIEMANDKYPICTSNCRRDLFDLTWNQRHKELAKLSTRTKVFYKI